METDRSTLRAKVEAIPPVLALYFLVIGISLLFANKPMWETLDDIASEIFNA